MAMTVDTKKNEGYSPTPYADTRGIQTIGYGFNMQDPVTRSLLPADVAAGKRAITQAESNDIYAKRMEMAKNDAMGFLGQKNYAALDQTRQSILNDMAYNMGGPALKKFKKMQVAMQDNDYDTAADEMQNSRWYKQTGQRSRNLVSQMRAGTPQQVLGQAVEDQLQ